MCALDARFDLHKPVDGITYLTAYKCTDRVTATARFVLNMINKVGPQYLPQHQCAHDKRTEYSHEAENRRRIEAVDTRDVAGSEKRRQQKEDLI